eukprot:TRINITY_DN11992_c0_g1_i1.p1 TRINITY_DN11992_c0_g1~~TRINITY_DN11992_c0_g1_i1.p1  ORF type:complete len:477 (+),score=75.33 TRINITY_DN11992_c0_g1_i1:54-1433(+)
MAQSPLLFRESKRRHEGQRPVRRMWMKREQQLDASSSVQAPALDTALQQSPSPPAQPARPESRQNAFSAFTLTLPGSGRNAPARRRPLSDNRLLLPGQVPSRPTSAAPSQPQVTDDFEAELAMIGELNLAEKAAQAKYVLPPQQAQPTDTEEEPPASLPAQSGGVGRPIHVPYRPDLRANMSADTRVHTHLAQKPMSFRDYQLLAEACQRAGRARMEGHAYYKQGELLAQSKDTLRKALPYFKKYLSISRRLNDLQGEAKALNCVGIVLQELGAAEDLREALEYHQQHSEIADAAGIFIANTNIGLLYGRLGELARSIEHHKQALQFAVRAGDKQAEALALANLGLMGRTQGDHTTAKVCIERHLELSAGMRDDEASCDAYEQLGMLSSERRDWVPASDFLLQAMDLSAKQGNQGKTNAIRCKIGFVNGTMRMEEHFRTVAKLMGAKQEKRRRRSSGGA